MWRSCYQSFQREVSSHQPLTSSVLHTGQLLLSCINATSPCQCVTCIMSQKPQPFSSFSFSQVFMPSPFSFPVLRDTLLLIEKQSRALGTHTEHFYSSILSAMDSLTQPRPVQQSREEDPGLVGVKGSALWTDCRMWTSMIYFTVCLFFMIFQQFSISIQDSFISQKANLTFWNLLALYVCIRWICMP